MRVKLAGRNLIIPKLPVSALIFYLVIFLLWKVNIIPSPGNIFNWLEGLFQTHGLTILFFSTLLEGLVYVGLYFPGSTIILLSVILSDGRPITLLTISIIVAIGLTITSVVNYVIGKFFSKANISIQASNLISRNLLLAALHPDSLAFYFFKLGSERKPLKELLGVPLVMTVYGVLLAYIFYTFKTQVRLAIETPNIVIGILLMWLFIALAIENKSKRVSD